MQTIRLYQESEISIYADYFTQFDKVIQVEFLKRINCRRKIQWIVKNKTRHYIPGLTNRVL